MRLKLQKLNIRLAAACLAVLVLLCSMPMASAATAEGECGDNLTWRLSGDALVIEGKGDMWDFPESTMAPWYEYRHDIYSVRLPKGLTSVGSLAFYDCSNLIAVTLPDSVKSVGRYSFALCTGMTMLDLGSGLQTIERAAFRECESLTSVRLPNSLKTMEFQAFYRCSSLRSITVPSSVTEMGMTTFAYCYDLVRADVRANISELPEWTFYGCENLTDVILPATVTESKEYAFFGCTSLDVVSSTGSAENIQNIQSAVNQDLERTHNPIPVTQEKPAPSSSYIGIRQEGTSIVKEEVTITETENALISTTITTTYPDMGSGKGVAGRTEAKVTLENAKGWQEVKETITAAAEEAPVKTDVYLKNDTSLKRDAINDLAGKDVVIEFHNTSGSSWQVDCSSFGTTEAEKKEESKKKGSIDLSCERSDATPEQLALLGSDVGYRVTFSNNAEVNATVMIKLPNEHAGLTVCLYQIVDKELQPIQGAVVDSNGFASFYLGRVDKKTVYLIGVDIPEAADLEVVIPESMYVDYGITDRLAPVKYMITGRTSSWGIGINQVTWMLVGGMFMVVTIVGVTMYMLNKRKLSLGYIPDLSDEDEDGIE